MPYRDVTNPGALHARARVILTGATPSIQQVMLPSLCPGLQSLRPNPVIFWQVQRYPLGP